MCELLPITDRNGAPKRCAVSRSNAVMPNEPSPNRQTTSFSGAASFAAMENPVPTPSEPSAPGSIHCPGRCGRTACAEMVTMSPPSPT